MKFLVILHRVNPDTNFCDDSGRRSSFYTDVYFVSIKDLKTDKEHTVVC